MTTRTRLPRFGAISIKSPREVSLEKVLRNRPQPYTPCSRGRIRHPSGQSPRRGPNDETKKGVMDSPRLQLMVNYLAACWRCTETWTPPPRTDLQTDCLGLAGRRRRAMRGEVGLAPTRARSVALRRPAAIVAHDGVGRSGKLGGGETSNARGSACAFSRVFVWREFDEPDRSNRM